MVMNRLAGAGIVLGFALVIAGLALIYPPLALIVAGAGPLALSLDHFRNPRGLP